MGLGEAVSGPEAKKSIKSLEKSLPGPGPKSPKKVSKKVRKVKKKSENGFLETFRTFFETFFGLLGPRAGRLFRDFFETFSRLFRDFFETFLRLFGFWPRDSFSPGPRNLNSRGPRAQGPGRLFVRLFGGFEWERPRDSCQWSNRFPILLPFVLMLMKWRTC